ncbi:ATPase [Micromonospora sp. WMMD714]|uniref:ATPase n=1 Tax=Micromonospora sp. WMMD714 TaxID=3016097 RepID=UPI00249B31D4|nr:ATPase [Micromonospora sp. WMMD714]WFE66319.1 ATPase [Micromonospora sp. WMMD714]
MRFSVVDSGYDPRQVDFCLDELAVRLTRLAARAEVLAGAERDADQLRQEATLLLALVDRRRADGDRAAARPADDRTAVDLLARARGELDAAREEARYVRERVYAEAVEARREFEASLRARRHRADRTDHLLSGLTVESVPVDTPTAAAGGVPATRPATGTDEAPVDQPEPGTRVA